jgi:hypothetical protein
VGALGRKLIQIKILLGEWILTGVGACEGKKVFDDLCQALGFGMKNRQRIAIFRGGALRPGKCYFRLAA